jgi:diguanylate cyclase (GGDEF)-like protein
LLTAIGAADYASGPDITLSLFYLLVVALIGWSTRGIDITIVGAVVTALVWLLAEWLTLGAPAPGILLWNASTRLIILIGLGVLICRLCKALDTQQALARTDFLTGALNARAFAERAEAELARAHRYGHSLTIAYIDLDDFKQVNDRFGHSRGDALLCSIVATLSKNIRRTDSLARLGGDEFALLLPETGYEAARALLPALSETLRAAMRQDGVASTFSMGVAVFDAPPTSVDALLKYADKTMYEAKAMGKNRFRMSRVTMDETTSRETDSPRVRAIDSGAG